MKYIKNIIIILFIVVTAFFSSIFTLRKFIYPLKYFDTVKYEASKNIIDPYLILSIIKVESNFNEKATSKKDAKGLMQILNSTAKEINDNLNIVDKLEDNDIYDENLNIAFGTKYLSSLIKKYNGNYYLAICAYNAGMGNVDKWLLNDIIPNNLDKYENISLPFEETKNYLKNVMRTYKIYKILY